MARITRKELKTDKFALEVEHTVDFFEEHKSEIIRYGAAALALAAIVVLFIWYRGHEHTLRQEALAKAMAVVEAPVGQAGYLPDPSSLSQPRKPRIRKPSKPSASWLPRIPEPTKATSRSITWVASHRVRAI